jgi:hypothetical protein
LLMIRKYLKSFKYSCHRGRTLYSDDTSWLENTWNHLNTHVIGVELCTVMIHYD